MPVYEQLQSRDELDGDSDQLTFLNGVTKCATTNRSAASSGASFLTGTQPPKSQRPLFRGISVVRSVSSPMGRGAPGRQFFKISASVSRCLILARSACSSFCSGVHSLALMLFAYLIDPAAQGCRPHIHRCADIGNRTIVVKHHAGSTQLELAGVGLRFFMEPPEWANHIALKRCSGSLGQFRAEFHLHLNHHSLSANSHARCTASCRAF